MSTVERMELLHHMQCSLAKTQGRLDAVVAMMDAGGPVVIRRPTPPAQPPPDVSIGDEEPTAHYRVGVDLHH